MRIFIFCLIIMLPTFGHGGERPGRIGVGLMLGEPTGLSGKLFFDDRHAVDAGLSFSFIRDSFHVHADYLVHVSEMDGKFDGGRWSPYVGVGGMIRVADREGTQNDGRLGVRIPIGVALHLDRRPFDVFFEFVPGMGLLPETRFDLGGAIGGRYFF
ncbi:MAG: hypothetical protein VX589_07735 [Myxococcota bacterium]|nr:hypothetical protein [Myxococcota bacterium]